MSRGFLLATLLVFASGQLAVAGDDDENPLVKKPAAKKTPAKRPAAKKALKRSPKKAPKKAPKKWQPKQAKRQQTRAKPKKQAPEPEPEIEMEPELAKPSPPPVVEEVKPEPMLAAVKVTAKSATAPYKKLYLRAGIVHVAPLEQSRELELADVDGPASLAVQNGPIAGSGSSISSATVPGLIIGYRVRPRWAIETVLGIPFTVKFKATGTLRDMSIAPTALGIPTGVPAIGEELGEAKAAPPTLTAVYDLTQGRIRPYAGAGLSILFAYGGKLTNPILTEVSQPEMKISPAPGLVLQGGVEAKITNRVYARADIKFIALMLARARVEHVQVRAPDLPLFDTVEVGTAKMNVWVNPLIVQLGIGTDF